MKVERYRKTRSWAVYDDDGVMICLTLYKKGANEVKRRMEELLALSSKEPTMPIDQLSMQCQGAAQVEEDTTIGLATPNAGGSKEPSVLKSHRERKSLQGDAGSSRKSSRASKCYRTNEPAVP